MSMLKQYVSFLEAEHVKEFNLPFVLENLKKEWKNKFLHFFMKNFKNQKEKHFDIKIVAQQFCPIS